MRVCLAIVFLLSNYANLWGQEFDESDFLKNQALVDSFYAAEAYSQLEIAVDRQVDYLIETERYDSLHSYVYKSGRAKSQLGKTPEGIDRAEYLVSLIEKEVRDSSDILFAINELSWVYYEAGLDSMCMVTDLRYLNFCKKYQNADATERSDAHYNMGFDHQVIGETPEAIFHFKKALAIIEEDTTILTTKRIDCYNALGATYWKYGDMTKAKKALKKSSELSLLMEDTVMANFYAANAIGNLSLAYEDEGNLAKSMELLELSIALRKASLPHVVETYNRDIQRKHLISNYHNLAALYLSIGDLDRALAMTEYVHDLQTEYFPEDRKRYVGYEESRGSIKRAAGDFAGAEVHLLNSLKGSIEGYGEVNYHTLNRHKNLGQLYQEWGKYEKALFHIGQTIEIAGQVSDEIGSQELARAYQLRAAVRMGMRNFSGAHVDLARSATIFSENFSEAGNPIGEILLERAEVFLKQNKRDSAEVYVNKSLAIFESNRSANQSAENGNYRGLVKMLPDALLLKAELTSDSDEESLKKALVYLDSALDYLRQERRNFDSDGAQLSFIDQHSAIYSAAASKAYQLYRLTGKEHYRDAVFRYAEERKTVLLKRQLNKFSSLRVSQVPDSIIARERSLVKLFTNPDSKVNYGDLEQEYDDLILYIRQHYPAYYELRYSAKTASKSDIQSSILKQGQTLVEYVQGKDELLVFVVTTKKIELLKIEGENIKKQILAFNRAIIARNQVQCSQIGNPLREVLFAPLEEYIDGDEIFIIPDGPLYALNFEALPNAQTGRFLIEDYTLSYLLSATTSLLYQNLDSPADADGVLAMAPGFAHDENMAGSGERYIRQPFAMRTAQAVGDMFSGQSLLASQATEERFKKDAAKHKIIHFGTHAEVNTASPMLSRLILTRSEKEDGYLHAYEIYNLPLRAELAVLTACETGVGKESSSEGVLSMAHGFAYAGCPSLVMSLWEIDEKTSAQIIESFYENLSDGKAKNEALRLAKLEYLMNAKGELKNPYYWSGLVMFGNTDPIESSSSTWWIVFGLSGILLVLLIARAQRKKAA